MKNLVTVKNGRKMFRSIHPEPETFFRLVRLLFLIFPFRFELAHDHEIASTLIKSLENSERSWLFLLSI